MHSARYPSHAGGLDADGGVERALGDGGRLVNLSENALADRLPNERDADHDHRCARAEVARAVAHARVGERPDVRVHYGAPEEREGELNGVLEAVHERQEREEESSSSAKWWPRRWRTEAIAETTIACVICTPFGAPVVPEAYMMQERVDDVGRRWSIGGCPRPMSLTSPCERTAHVVGARQGARRWERGVGSAALRARRWERRRR